MKYAAATKLYVHMSSFGRKTVYTSTLTQRLRDNFCDVLKCPMKAFSDNHNTDNDIKNYTLIITVTQLPHLCAVKIAQGN